MAGQSSPKGPGKISVECPHCTSRQQESVFAKTTFCRKCGKHFDLERKAAPVPAGAKETSFFSRLTRFLSREKIRTIHCFDCKKEHQVSSFAKSSFCSSCGGYIDLRDFKITGNFSRSIQTQGKIIIGPKGDVTSSKIACGEAVIRGKLQGNLLCSGKVRIKFKGRVIGALDVKHLVVEKRSNIEFVRPLKVGIAEINGKVSARVNADSIKIGKTGTLDGTVYAKAISVEKGGFCLGSLFIGKQELSQPELIPEPKASPSGIMNLGNQSVLAL